MFLTSKLYAMSVSELRQLESRLRKQLSSTSDFDVYKELEEDIAYVQKVAQDSNPSQR